MDPDVWILWYGSWPSFSSILDLLQYCPSCKSAAEANNCTVARPRSPSLPLPLSRPAGVHRVGRCGPVVLRPRRHPSPGGPLAFPDPRPGPLPGLPLPGGHGAGAAGLRPPAARPLQAGALPRGAVRRTVGLLHLLHHRPVPVPHQIRNGESWASPYRHVPLPIRHSTRS